MLKKVSLIFVMMLMITSLTLTAGEQKAMNMGQKATFEGTLVCLGCTLKSEEGARAACKEFGHTHALKTEDGKFINFLENKYSQDLLKGEKYGNKKITVRGIYHASANLMDVESFTVDGKMKTWCDHCKAMDGCATAGK